MFATLLGALPRPPLPVDATPVALLTAVVRAQEEAGLEPVTEAGCGVGVTVVERWQSTAALTDRAVKGVLVGPYSAAAAAAAATARDDRQLDSATFAAADALRSDVLALAAAGCPVIEIHEPDAAGIGTDPVRRTRFREAHRRLLEGVAGPHLSLAITGGNADTAGIETLLDAPYASLAVDLIAGPDNWRLIATVPGERGVICGALSSEAAADDGPEVLLWAAGYAASTGGRGPARVGLASASSLAALSWDRAMRKLAALGEAARLADLPPDERRLRLDPRSVDIRSAALGRVMPRERIRRRPGHS
jgi:methionine synthase II (cobalamin-independent)